MSLIGLGQAASETAPHQGRVMRWANLDPAHLMNAPPGSPAIRLQRLVYTERTLVPIILGQATYSRIDVAVETGTLTSCLTRRPDFTRLGTQRKRIQGPERVVLKHMPTGLECCALTMAGQMIGVGAQDVPIGASRGTVEITQSLERVPVT
jgi:hypothetical protein